MEEGRHVFRSKSRVNGLGMSDVIGWFVCMRFRFRSISSHSITTDRIRSGSGILILAFPIPSSLWVRFRLRFFIHTGTKGSLRFRFRRKWNQPLVKYFVESNIWKGTAFLPRDTENFSKGKRRYNAPFYSCGWVTWLMTGSEAAGDLVLIQTSLLFLCKRRLVSITKHDLHDKNSEVCVNTRSPAPSLPFIGLVTD